MFEYYQVHDRMRTSLRGYGAAVRKETDAAIPGEPFVSMESALSQTSREACKMLKEQSKSETADRFSITAITAGVLTAVVAIILYFLDLPIFSRETIGWVIFSGLIGSALLIFGLVVRNTWESDQ